MHALVLASVAAWLLTTLAWTAPAGADVVGHVRVAIASNAGFPSYSYTADHEQVVILQSWETAELEALKAANPNVKVLMYQDASSASTTASADGLYPTGVSYDEAAQHGWLLTNRSGSPFSFGGYPWLYATDIGSVSYQNAWASNVLAKLSSAPWDGVFMDDVNPTIQYDYCVSCVAKYPSDASYGAAMGSFVANVGPQIQAAGKLAVANIGSWSSYPSEVDPWLKSLSGAMDEQFLKWGTQAGSGYASPGVWATQLHEVALAQSENKLFIGITHSSATDEQAAVYGYATELLAAKGDAVFAMDSDYTQETWFPEYGYALGHAVGSYRVDRDGVYRRAFSGGLVLVNPTSDRVAVDFGGVYHGSGLTDARRASMPAHSGLVLLNGSGDAVATAARSRHRRTRTVRKHLARSRGIFGASLRF